MLNSTAFLSPKTLESDIEQAPTRNGYGEGLVRAGENNEQVVALCADLSESTRSEGFQKKFPERYVQVGVAEQNMATVAAGLALAGKIPFMASYATFSPGRNNEQIRTTIAIGSLNVKIVGAHAGVSVGPDGATHQALEDIGLMRMLPHMSVVYPCDALEARKATEYAALHKGPVYLRFAREKTPLFTTEKTPFQFGKVGVFQEGTDATIIACGPLVHEALLAAHALSSQGISVEVLNCHTIKPLDKEGILASVKKTKAVVTVEEHQVVGGLGSAVAELLAKEFPAPIEFVGMQDRYGESGEPQELLEAFHLTAPWIEKAVQNVMKRA
ncbi:MAG: transketolase C-terminal domain-containing protein [bacterium]|nr:transketolase C-terminal domain-containing protein [bacterium]